MKLLTFHDGYHIMASFTCSRVCVLVLTQIQSNRGRGMAIHWQIVHTIFNFRKPYVEHFPGIAIEHARTKSYRIFLDKWKMCLFIQSSKWTNAVHAAVLIKSTSIIREWISLIWSMNLKLLANFSVAMTFVFPFVI